MQGFWKNRRRRAWEGVEAEEGRVLALPSPSRHEKGEQGIELEVEKKPPQRLGNRRREFPF